MSVRQDIRQDTVPVKWFRTAVTTFISLTTALGIIWAAVVWAVSPRVDAWGREVVATGTAEIRTEFATAQADLRRGLEETQGHVERLGQVVAALEVTVGVVSDNIAIDASPSWRFSVPDTRISDGRIGGEVRIEVGGYKMRDCGVPVVDLYFVNGGGVYHRFEHASLLSDDNRGIALPVDPARLAFVNYTAIIPENDGVHPGRGQGFISITYPDRCPAIPAAVSGPLQFRILAKGDRQ